MSSSHIGRHAHRDTHTDPPNRSRKAKANSNVGAEPQNGKHSAQHGVGAPAAAASLPAARDDWPHAMASRTR